jgi:exodeoxyribonuclease V alpha subunit
MIVEFCNVRKKLELEYKGEQLNQLTIAYAITIHKSQGSQYPCVITCFMMRHKKMLQRKLFYTAITRAEEEVITIGERQAIGIAIKTKDTSTRYSHLKEKLIFYKEKFIGTNIFGKN